MFSVLIKKTSFQKYSFVFMLLYDCMFWVYFLLHVNCIHQLSLSAFFVSGKRCRMTSKPYPVPFLDIQSVMWLLRSSWLDSFHRSATCWWPGRTFRQLGPFFLSPVILCFLTPHLDLGSPLLLSRKAFLSLPFFCHPHPSFQFCLWSLLRSFRANLMLPSPFCVPWSSLSYSC